MPLWKRFWLLLSVIWLVVAALNAATILAFSEETDKVWRPVALGVAVPALAYLVLWAWARWKARCRRTRARARPGPPRGRG